MPFAIISVICDLQPINYASSIDVDQEWAVIAATGPRSVH